jgi:hypothetical protein
MSDKTERPDFVTDEHLPFLDDLRESGITNMFGARPWIQEEFGLDKNVSAKILTYWMNSFSERHPS